MNFIVGILLLKLSNEDAFNMAFHILHWQKHAKLLMNLQNVNQKFHVLKSKPPLMQDSWPGTSPNCTPFCSSTKSTL